MYLDSLFELFNVDDIEYVLIEFFQDTYTAYDINSLWEKDTHFIISKNTGLLEKNFESILNLNVPFIIDIHSGGQWLKNNYLCQHSDNGIYFTLNDDYTNNVMLQAIQTAENYLDSYNASLIDTAKVLNLI